MIRLIPGIESTRYPREMEAMFRARAAVFDRRLGWNVSVVKGKEIDHGDTEVPVYLVFVDDRSGEIAGSARLLPTTGPSTFGGCYSALFDEPIDLESAAIWECGRFCIHPSAKSSGSIRNATRIMWELNLAICELGLRAGVSQIQAVYDQFMVKVYEHAPWRPTPMSKSNRFGRLPIFVGLWDVSEATLAELQRASGISHSVVERPEIEFWREVS